MARSRLSRRRAPNGQSRYINPREQRQPRTMFFASGNRSYGRPPEADR